MTIAQLRARYGVQMSRLDELLRQLEDQQLATYLTLWSAP